LTMPSRNLPTTAAGDPKAKAQRNYRFAGLRLHRSRLPHPQRWGRLDPGLQLPGGGRWRPPDHRGGGGQQSGSRPAPLPSQGGADRGQYRPAAREADRRCGLLQHKQHRGERAARAGCLPLYQPAGARQAATAITGSSPKRSGCTGLDGPQTSIQSRPSDLHPPQDHRRTGLWSD